MNTSSAVNHPTHSSFALRTFNELLNRTPRGENLCYSPFGVQVILALLHELSTEESRAAIEHAFEYGVDDVAENIRDVQRRRRAYNATDSIRVASSLWMRSPCKLASMVAARIREQLGTDSFTRDFTTETVSEINRWAWENTSGHIASIIQDVSQMQLLAANAIYFNCGWQEPFEEFFNRREWFTLDDASKVMRLRMTAERWFDYYEDEECQAVTLDYVGFRFSMQIVLPNKGIFLPSVLKNTDHDKWMKQFGGRPGLFEWPGFTFDCAPPISTHIFGVPGAITIDRNVVLDARSAKMPVDLRQETWIEANEKGTEVVGITVSTVLGTVDNPPPPPPPKPFEMIVDRPFYFMIVDRYDDVVLFMGRVADPMRT